ncbi:hypothetical protein Q2T40_07975 [Winogradskyella maritima]|uniref:Superfamily III holin-X n=1 Tax=Winogradskyella maritima TaxID=1517766 RepID=A0ABV8AKM2_9FLAO|nr:hypothetical protein [Winogradskyella maritima]
MLNSLNETSDKAMDIGERYVNTTRQYLKLKIFQQLSVSISMMVKLLAIGAFVFIGLIFFAIAGAIELGEAFGSTTKGCLAVGGIALVFGVIIYLMRKRINTLVLNKMADKF